MGETERVCEQGRALRYWCHSVFFCSVPFRSVHVLMKITLYYKLEVVIRHNETLGLVWTPDTSEPVMCVCVCVWVGVGWWLGVGRCVALHTKKYCLYMSNYLKTTIFYCLRF